MGIVQRSLSPETAPHAPYHAHARRDRRIRLDAPRGLELRASLETELQFVPLCERCRVHQGLCTGCAENDKGILPQIAENEEWFKLMSPGGANESYVGPIVFQVSTPGTSIELPPIGAPGRKRAKLSRLGRALQGEHTRAA